MDNVVLVVDDSPESLGMLNVALNSQGYTALVALNGAQALSIAEKIEPDIVLMDAVMPEMDGFETCRRLKISCVYCTAFGFSVWNNFGKPLAIGNGLENSDRVWKCLENIGPFPLEFIN